MGISSFDQGQEARTLQQKPIDRQNETDLVQHTSDYNEGLNDQYAFESSHASQQNFREEEFIDDFVDEYSVESMFDTNTHINTQDYEELSDVSRILLEKEHGRALSPDKKPSCISDSEPSSSTTHALSKLKNASDEYDGFQLDSIIDDFVMTDELKYSPSRQNSSQRLTKELKIRENDFDLRFNEISQPSVTSFESYFEDTVKAQDLGVYGKEWERKSTRQKDKLPKDSQRGSRRDSRRDSHKEDKKESKKESKKDRKDSRKDRESRRGSRSNRDFLPFDADQGRDKDHASPRSSTNFVTSTQNQETVKDTRTYSAFDTLDSSPRESCNVHVDVYDAENVREQRNNNFSNENPLIDDPFIPHIHSPQNSPKQIHKQTQGKKKKQNRDKNQNDLLYYGGKRNTTEKGVTTHQTVNSLFDSESEHSDTTDRTVQRSHMQSKFPRHAISPSVSHVLPSSSLSIQTPREGHQTSLRSDELALFSSSLRAACESTHASIVGETLSHLHEVQQVITRRLALHEKSTAVSFENHRTSSEALINLRLGTLSREVASINSRTQGIELRIGGLEVEFSSLRADSFQYLRTLSLENPVDKTQEKPKNMEKKITTVSSRPTQLGNEENEGWQFTLNSLRHSLGTLQDKMEDNLRNLEQRLSASTKLITTGLKTVDEQAVSLENRITLSLKAREENSSSAAFHRFSVFSKEIEKRLAESTRLLQAGTAAQRERIELAMETSAAAQSTSADALEHVLVLKNAVKEVNKTAKRLDEEQTKAKMLLLALQRDVEVLQTQVSVKKVFDENDLKRNIRPIMKDLLGPMVDDMVHSCVRESFKVETQKTQQKSAATMTENSADTQNKIQHMVQEEVKNVSFGTLKKDIFDGLRKEVHGMVQKELQVAVQHIMQNVGTLVQQSVAATVEAKMREWSEKNLTGQQHGSQQQQHQDRRQREKQEHEGLYQ